MRTVSASELFSSSFCSLSSSIIIEPALVDLFKLVRTVSDMVLGVN